MREEGERIMRKRDEAKNRREIIHALSMIMQIGLSMMVCMSVSLLIGYGLDKLFGTKYLSSININVVDSTQIDATKDIIIQKLLQRYGITEKSEANFQIVNLQDILATFLKILDVFKLFLGGIAAISLIV